jgi:hypothetical protein
MLCGRADIGEAEHCARDAAATPAVFSSCGADNNGNKFDVLLEEVHEGTSDAVESGVGVNGDEVATAIVERLSCSRKSAFCVFDDGISTTVFSTTSSISCTSIGTGSTLFVSTEHFSDCFKNMGMWYYKAKGCKGVGESLQTLKICNRKKGKKKKKETNQERKRT